jgi:hypothetical protein
MNATSEYLQSIVLACNERDQSLLDSSLAGLLEHMQNGGTPADSRVDIGIGSGGCHPGTESKRRNWIGSGSGARSIAVMVTRPNDAPETGEWMIHGYAYDGSMTFAAVVMLAAVQP